jgi:predicted RNA binding protein YcfA (HicA-like mRNA interferase family)
MDIVRKSLPIIEEVLPKLCAWVDSTKNLETTTGASIEEFEKNREFLISHLQWFLSLLESPLLSYDTRGQGILQEKKVEVRKKIIEEGAQITIPSLGEISEESKVEILQWLNIFCIPLRMMITKLENHSIIDEKKNPAAPLASSSNPETKTKKKKNFSSVKAIKKSHPAFKNPQTNPRKPVEDSFEHLPSEDPGEKENLSLTSKEVPEERLATLVEEERRSPAPVLKNVDPSSVVEANPIGSGPKPQPISATPVRVKRKERDSIPPRINSVRKLINLMQELGFEVVAGGRHMQFRKIGTEVRIPFPYHGNGSIAPGTSHSIVSQALELAGAGKDY